MKVAATKNIIYIAFIYLMFSNHVVLSQSTTDKKFKTIRTYNITSAKQGVAVDKNYFYTINNTGIEKYNKSSGEFIGKWEDIDKKLKHFNSGVVIGNKLYCSHSNYPDLPMVSSIEIFDTRSLQHIRSHSFGIKYGSCTWFDYYDNYFWACFANYDRYKDEIHKDHKWTVLVKFDKEFKEISSWCFPAEVLSIFKPMSCSGGSWGSDGFLYVTGHDSTEVYKLQIPQMSSVLDFIDVIKIESEGQGIAWDRFEKNTLFSIRRKTNQVLISILDVANF